mmetsp:Transcript_20075/g.49177  ORF Transcript_20075/g.49177 Transcript_20075/m.49177 type:complete len:214 (-) Transcript_20075:1370-2011(-)
MCLTLRLKNLFDSCKVFNNPASCIRQRLLSRLVEFVDIDLSFINQVFYNFQIPCFGCEHERRNPEHVSQVHICISILHETSQHLHLSSFCRYVQWRPVLHTLHDVNICICFIEQKLDHIKILFFSCNMQRCSAHIIHNIAVGICRYKCSQHGNVFLRGGFVYRPNPILIRNIHRRLSFDQSHKHLHVLCCGSNTQACLAILARNIKIRSRIDQ